MAPLTWAGERRSWKRMLTKNRLALTPSWKSSHPSQAVEEPGLCPSSWHRFGQREKDRTGDPHGQGQARHSSAWTSCFPISEFLPSVIAKHWLKQFKVSISILLIWNGPHWSIKYRSHSLLKQTHSNPFKTSLENIMTSWIVFSLHLSLGNSKTTPRERKKEKEEKHLGVGCCSFLQGIFPIQGWNLGLLHCRQILYHLR